MPPLIDNDFKPPYGQQCAGCKLIADAEQKATTTPDAYGIVMTCLPPNADHKVATILTSTIRVPGTNISTEEKGECQLFPLPSAAMEPSQ